MRSISSNAIVMCVCLCIYRVCDLFEAGGTKKTRQKVQEQPGQDGDNNETVATNSSSSAIDFAVEQPQVEQQVQVPHLDIGLFIGKNDISDDVKYQLLKNRWRPDNTYNFPKIQQNKQSRSFSLKWLVTYEWLAYSHEKGDAFCAECVFFAKPTIGKSLHQSTGCWSVPHCADIRMLLRNLDGTVTMNLTTVKKCI